MSASRARVQVAISLDVEEDGLGCGRYPRVAPGVANVAALERLEFVARDFQLPLTLLATYPVIMDRACADRLVQWHECRGAEIGAHLHPWNTPPFSAGPSEQDGCPTPLDAEKMDVLRAAIAERTGMEPISFRMGRFAVHEKLFDDLRRAGFRRDASLVPFHETSGALAAYTASPDPYRLRPATGSSAELWEIPLTNLPVWPRAGRWMAATAAAARRPWQIGLQRAFQRCGVVGLHPAWFSLPAMCWAARLQVARGGRLLHLFLHSSELSPGGTPAFRTEDSVQRLVNRLAAFLNWLRREYTVEGATLGSLALD